MFCEGDLSPCGTGDSFFDCIINTPFFPIPVFAFFSYEDTRGNLELEQHVADEPNPNPDLQTNSHTNTPTPTLGQQLPTKKQSDDGGDGTGAELRDSRGQHRGQHQHSSSLSTAERDIRHVRSQPSVSYTSAFRAADGQAFTPKPPVHNPPLGALPVAPLRPRRPGPSPIYTINVANNAPPKPPSSLSSATDIGSYSETELVTTDDEYQVLAHGDGVLSPSGGAWRLAQLKSSGSEPSRRRATIPALHAIAVADSMPSPALTSSTIKGSPSTSSFARFLTRPKKRATLDDESSEGQSIVEKAAADAEKAAAKERKRREQEKKMLAMLSHSVYR